MTMSNNRQERTNRFVGLSLFLMIFFSALRVPLDSDFFWHIHAGAISISEKAPLLVDLFSFSRYGATWVNHSWLSEIIYYLIFHYFSYRGVMIFVAVIATLTMWLIYRRMKGSALLRSFVMIFTILISAVIWAPRPQLFTLLCFAILANLIDLFLNTKERKYALYILLLFLVWSNLHAGFSIGIAYLGLILAGRLIDGILIKEVNGVDLKFILVLLGLIILSSVIVCLNPNGVNVWKVQFDTVSIRSLQNFIDEWASPNFHQISLQPYLWVWMLFVFLLAVGQTSFSVEQILPIVFFGALGFIAKRNFAPFAIVIFPPLSELIIAFYKSRIEKSWFFIEIKKLTKIKNVEPKLVVQKGINLCVVGVIFLFVMAKILYLGAPQIMEAYESNQYPAEAINYLSLNGFPDGNVLNPYEWGGYIAWKIPNLKIFVDGRTDLFGDKIILDWLKMVNADEGWEVSLKDYEIHWVFLKPGTPLIKELSSRGWQTIYEDQQVNILVE